MPLINREGRKRIMILEPEDLPAIMHQKDSTSDRGCIEVVDYVDLKKDNLDEKLTEKEKKLVKILRGIDYGEVKIFVQGKQPVRIEELTKSIKL